jgi:arylsulfatase A-like enzyme
MRNFLKKSAVFVSLGLIIIAIAVGIFFWVQGRMPVRHVIFISMDTTRADHFGCYGNTWIHTPAVDSLAKESLLFTNYYTVTPVTLASHTSLFTGKYPINHGVPANGYMVNKKNKMLAEILKEKGFQTIGFIGAFPLSKWFDFHQGFDYYNERFEKNLKDENVSHHQRSAQQVTDSVINYFNKNGFPDRLFLFVHYFDPHNPYDPPMKYKKMYKHPYREYNEIIDCRGRQSQANETSGAGAAAAAAGQKKKARYYAGEISYMDAQIGRLFAYLRTKKILDHSIVILTSDHGENLFWDRNPFSHGWDTYQGDIKAVCIIRTPGTLNNPQKVEQLVTNIDILPSLLKYLKLPIPGDIDGQAFDLNSSHWTPLQVERFIESSKPAERVNNRQWRNGNNARCIIADGFKYIQTPYLKTEEFYHLAADPFEIHNMIDSKEVDTRKRIRTMKRKLQKWILSARPMKSKFQEDQKKETIERLRSLGYL